MIFQHFFWDFDGTLYNSYHCVNLCAQMALADLGIHVSYDELMQKVKQSLATAAEAFAVPRSCQEQEFMQIYRRHAHAIGTREIQLYPGADKMLRAVVENGGKNYLYTHRGSLSAWECLDRDGLRPLFADAVTSDDGFSSKPAPDALNHLIVKHGLDRNACIMMGDRNIDLDAGKNAGIAGGLFDPDGFYPDYPTPWRFSDYDSMINTLITP